MSKNLSRRFMLSGLPMAGATLLAGCSFSTTKGVTKIIVDNAEVESYASVAVSVLKAALGFTGIPSVVVTAVDEGITILQAGIAAYVKSAGASTTLTFDKNSVPAALTSLINDFSTVAANISAVAVSEKSNLSTDLMSKISQVASDIASAGGVIDSLISALTSSSLAGTSAEVRGRLIIDNMKLRYGIN